MTWEGGFSNPTVGPAQIQDGSITSTKLADGAVIEQKLADLAVAAGKLQDEAVQNAKLADDSVSTPKVQDLAIVQAKIGLAAIGTAQIANLAVTDAKIDTLTANKLTAGTIDASVITVTNLNADNITTGELTALRYRTAASGKRLEIQADTGDDFLRFFDSSGTEKIQLGYDAVLDDFLIDLENGAGMHWFSEGNILLGNGFSGATGSIEITSNNRVLINSDNSKVALDAPTVEVTQGTIDTGSGGQGDTLNFRIHGSTKVSLNGNGRLLLQEQGSASSPSVALGDANTGWYRNAPNIEGSVNGTVVLILGGSGGTFPTTNNTASAANAHLSPSNVLQKSTSLAKHKRKIKDWKPRESDWQKIRTRAWESDIPGEKGQVFRGFVHEELPGVFQSHEAEDLRAIVAALVTRVKELERQAA